jgi:hypothetical protein
MDGGAPHPGDVEWLDVGPDAPEDLAGAPLSTRRRQSIAAAGIAAAAALIAIVAISNQNTSTPAAVSTTPAPSATVRIAPAASPPAVAVTELGHPLLGITGAWELFARGPSSVVRIEPARGRITTTTVPTLIEIGEVSFVVGTDRAIIRPQHDVPGYLLVDGKPVRELTGGLLSRAVSGVYPGPQPDQLWLDSIGYGAGVIPLVDIDGAPVSRTSITVPPGGYLIGRDGAGYLLVGGIGGVYDARPGGLRQITTGTLLAVGPTKWLVEECDRSYRCSRVVIDRASGARRSISGPVVQVFGGPGVISPDGRTAAVLEAADFSPSALHLIDLPTGADHGVAFAIDQYADEPGLVWSPDSRWLFATRDGGQLYGIDARDRQPHTLGVALPEVHQLELRAVGTD